MMLENRVGTLAGLIVAIVAILVTIFTPEIRCNTLGLSLGCPPKADSSETETQSSSAEIPSKTEVQPSPQDSERALSFIPSESNILIFNASNNPEAADNFEDFLISNSNLRRADTEDYWWHQWVMRTTRIYFLGESNKEIANRLEENLPGEQIVIDYDDQESYQDESLWLDKPADKYTRMEGFD